jgi:hypothetical protein
MYERLLAAEGIVAPAFQPVKADADASTSNALANQEPALAPLLGCFDSVSIAAADQYAPLARTLLIAHRSILPAKLSRVGPYTDVA